MHNPWVQEDDFNWGGTGGGGSLYNYDTMTWETRIVLIDRRSKKISDPPLSFALINSLGIYSV